MAVDGPALGLIVGDRDGAAVGSFDGAMDGLEGAMVGLTDVAYVCSRLAPYVGMTDGSAVGSVGDTEGA